MLGKLLVGVIFVSLVGTMTNWIYVSATATLFSVFLLPLLCVRSRYSIPKWLLYLWVFAMYTLCSVVVYHPASLLNFYFYRYDGNFFISYLPLLIFPFFSVEVNIKKILRNFLYIVWIVNGVLYIYQFINTRGGVLLSPTEGGNAANIFNPLFHANNAGGGFYSMLFSLSFAYYLSSKRFLYIVIGIFFILFLWGTASRGSILGMIGGILGYFFYVKRKRILIYWMLGITIVTQVIIIGKTYPHYERNILNNTTYHVRNDFELEGTKEANVYIRAYQCWPRAVFLFTRSPIVGTGFGSFNDDPGKIASIKTSKGFVDYEGNKLYDSSHAHHSFLHILAEEGIIGLLFFLLFWVHLFRYITSRRRRFPEVVRIFLITAYFNLTFMSFTEHRIVSPSNVFPFMLILVLAIMYDRTESRTIIQQERYHTRYVRTNCTENLKINPLNRMS
jgi:O-antigen ligase